MADFRRCLYALALVALLAGLTVPASAQAFQCSTNTSNVPLIRAEGFTELLGDIVLDCTGGTPTGPNQTVPTVSLTVALDQNVNITSKILATINGVNFLESLLIIDEPNSPTNPARPLLNCGQANALDNTAAGVGVCAILTDGVHGGGSTGAALTYDGTPQHPNVFQARAFANPTNQMVFSGLPIDPPGTVCPAQPSQPVCHRIIRITNIRGDAAGQSLTSTTNTRPINVFLNANPSQGLPVDAQSRPIATLQVGLIPGAFTPKLDFIQCSPLEGQSQAMVFTFQENFNQAFKPLSLTQTLANGAAKPSYAYANGLTPNIGAAVNNNQNVPGAVYDSESGFVNKFGTAGGDSAINPLTGQAGAGNAFTNTGCAAPAPCATGITEAGIASQGTRLALSFGGLQAGTQVSVPIVVNLKNILGGAVTGVAVLVANPLPSAITGAGGGLGGPGGGLVGNAQVAVGGTATTNAVYEVLFANPNAVETMAVALTVSSGTPNLSLNQPSPGLPASTISGTFAPFYNPPTATEHSAQTLATRPIPRFIQSVNSATFFQINRCSCNLLFPYVTNAAIGNQAFDTSLAITNTSFDPGGTQGFFASQQAGPVQLWFYSKNPTGLVPPGATTLTEPNFGNGQLNTQCTNATSPGSCAAATVTSVPSGGYLVYSLFLGGSIPGGQNAANGQVLQNAPGFTGYIIAQARFQYCHGFAYISKQNAGLTDPANTSMGYLAIVLDRPAGVISGSITGGLTLTGTITMGLPRTASSPGENDGH